MTTEDEFSGSDATGHLNVGRSAVRLLNASVAKVERSAIQRLSAQTVSAENSALGYTSASTVKLHQSAIAVAAGDYVRVEDSRVLILVAPRVSGNVRAVITVPAALAMAAGYVFARALVSSLAGRKSKS